MSVDKNSTSMVPINSAVSLTLDYEQSFLICDAVARVIDSQPKNKIAVGESRGTLLRSIHFHCFFFFFSFNSRDGLFQKEWDCS